MNGKSIASLPIHLGLGATAEVEPPFTGALEWYEAYSKRHEKDGIEGRLVSMHMFDAPWPMWEMHPYGSEVVLCTAGCMTLYQENAVGDAVALRLEAGHPHADIHLFILAPILKFLLHGGLLLLLGLDQTLAQFCEDDAVIVAVFGEVHVLVRAGFVV